MKTKTVPVLGLLCLTLAFAALAPKASAQETLIWTANVYSDGASVTSPVLELGTTYRIEASEIWWYNVPGGWGLAADAYYYTTGWNGWDWTNSFPAPDGHSFLQIDGMDVNWGPFSNGDAGHTYNITYTGTGSPITFRIVDWIDGNNSNNYCHLPVEIWALPPPPPPPPDGRSPGYWKHQFHVYFNTLGSAQESWDDLVAWTATIDDYYGTAIPDFYGYPLPPVSAMDTDSDGIFEPEDAYTILWNKQAWKAVWLGCANWYNWAAGYGVYVDFHSVGILGKLA